MLQEIYPRLLVVNADALQQPSGSGTTVANLFADWPKDQLAQIYLNRRELGEAAGCSRTWRLEFVKDRIPGVRKSSWRVPKQVGSNRIAAARGQAAGSREYRSSAIASCIKGIARTMLDAVPYRLDSRLLHEIHDFAPEVVYSCIGNIQLASLVDRLSRQEGAATVVHLMDDWIADKYACSLTWAWHRHKLVSLSRDLIKRSAARLAISDKMAREYENVFGRPFHVFMNCVEWDKSEQPTRPDPPAHTPVRFVYVGGLHLGRWQSLLEIGKALDAAAGNPSGRLIVHAPAADLASYFEGRRLPQSMEIGGPVPSSEVEQVLRRGDVMVHVESFGAVERRYTRLSISTKIPQYMSAGRPILAYGPGEVASCQYVSATGCGMVVGRQERGELAEALKRLCSDGDLRAALGRQGWRKAIEQHHADNVREHFRQVLADASRANRQFAEPAKRNP